MEDFIFAIALNDFQGQYFDWNDFVPLKPFSCRIYSFIIFLFFDTSSTLDVTKLCLRIQLTNITYTYTYLKNINEYCLLKIFSAKSLNLMDWC